MAFLKKNCKKILKNIAYYCNRICAESLLDPLIQEPKNVGHTSWPQYIHQHFDKPELSVLELGSREVTGPSIGRQIFKEARYTGFDFYPGANVDIVGDAHQLSTYFKAGERFDLIFSSAVFEHLAMPWLVAKEISKMLRLNGYVFVETHFSYLSHERPWNFFQFSDNGLKTLFSTPLGFQCCDAGMSNPLVAQFTDFSAIHLRRLVVGHLYCHSEYLGKKVSDIPQDFTFDSLKLSDILNKDCLYPLPNIR